MAIHVHCVCGSAIECDSLETVVTLRCPACRRELTLEYKGPARQRHNAVLRVHEGMHLLGEKFLIPVGEELVIGSGDIAWLCLKEGEVAPDHCQVRLDRHGVLTVKNLGSPQGTWIEQARIVEGVLEPGQDLRLGFYRLRIEKQRVEELVASAAPPVLDDADVPAPVPLMVMPAVDADENAMTWLLAHRFVLVRYGLIALVWITFIFHGLAIRTQYMQPYTDWTPYVLPGLGVLLSLVLLRFCGRVTLAEPRWSIAGIVTVALIAIVNACVMQWFPAGGAALLGVAAGILVLREPKQEHALGATFLGAVGLVMALIPMLWRLNEHLSWSRL